MAERYSLPVLDFYKISGLNPNIDIQRETYMPDGLHPSDEGYKKLAGIMEEFLKNSYYEKR